MITTIDKAGRMVISAEVRKRLGLAAGTERELEVDAARRLRSPRPEWAGLSKGSVQ